MKPPGWNRLLASGLRFVPSRGRQFTAVVVGQGRSAGLQFGMLFRGLVEIAHRGPEALRGVVRAGTDRQLAGLGLVTKADLVTFEQRLRRSETKASPQRKPPAVKPRTASKPAKGSSSRRGR